MSIERIEILKQLMRATSYTRSLPAIVSDKRGVDRSVSTLWFQSYDELEKLLDNDEEFEEFVDTLD